MGSISMVASTVFFLMEAFAVSASWKTSLHVGALVTLVAAVHYFYMREYWVILHSSPILYRYAGEGGSIDPYTGFFIGCAGWGYILQEIFAGEAGKCDPQNKYVKESFNTMRLIVTAGWSIYPLGYLFGYLRGAVDDAALNLVYNLADFVNNIAFCLAIWSCAKSSSLEGGK